MAELINVPYSRQETDGYCLPACAQMALAHLGISRSQQILARQMGIVQDFGIPASHLGKLRTRQVDVIYHKA